MLLLCLWHIFYPFITRIAKQTVIPHTQLPGKLELTVQHSHTNTLNIITLLSVSFSAAFHLHPYFPTLDQTYNLLNALFSFNSFICV